MIKFTTKNVDNECIDWSFNTIEEILIEWWTNDGLCLPSADDRIVGRKYTNNGKEYSASTFNDLINDIEIIYWNEKRIGVR